MDELRSFEGYVGLAVFVGLVFAGVVLIALASQAMERLGGLFPSVRRRREQEQAARDRRAGEIEAERRALDVSRAELVRSWHARGLSEEERREEYRAWVSRHDEHNPWPFRMLVEWERRFGPDPPDSPET